MRITGSREAGDPANRRYHVEMMLLEVGKSFAVRGGDTRGYLSIDEPECQILQELLEQEASRLRCVHHPALDK
jgi:hypothetical protein